MNTKKLDILQFLINTLDQYGVPVDLVVPDSRFIEDLGLDSLDVVEVVMEIEEEYALDIPDEDVEKLTTVGAAVKYIEGRLK